MKPSLLYRKLVAIGIMSAAFLVPQLTIEDLVRERLAAFLYGTRNVDWYETGETTAAGEGVGT